MLALQPTILLLDEPTANLDESNTRQIEDLVKQYSSEHLAGVIWVSHDSAQHSRLDSRHFRMEQGRIIAEE